MIQSFIISINGDNWKRHCYRSTEWNLHIVRQSYQWQQISVRTKHGNTKLLIIAVIELETGSLAVATQRNDMQELHGMLSSLKVNQ